MIEATASVVAVDGDRIQLVAQRQSACGSCAAKQGCGTSLLDEWFSRRQPRFEVHSELEVHVGDRVVIGLDEGRLQRGSLWLYAFPLGGLLAGALFGDWWFRQSGVDTELGAVLGGLGGLSAALIYVRKRANASPHGSAPEVHLLRVVGRDIRAQRLELPQFNQRNT